MEREPVNMMRETKRFSPELIIIFARRAKLNHEIMWIYLALICLLGAVFVLFHLIRHTAHKMRIGQRCTPGTSALVALSR